VRLRRTFTVPKTEEDFQAIWFTGRELQERRRRDKKLRYAIARQPEVYNTEKLWTLGLHTEEERRQRCKRAMAARSSILRSGLDSDSDDSSVLADASYTSHSQAAAVEARERARQHAAHVQTILEANKEEEETSSRHIRTLEPSMEIEEDPKHHASSSSSRMVVFS